MSVQRLLADLEALPPCWLRSRLQEWVRAGGDVSEVLELTGADRVEETTARRDYWLRRAAELAAPGAMPWPASGVLHEAIGRYLRVERESPPRDTVGAALWEASRFGALPTSRRQLHRVLSE